MFLYSEFFKCALIKYYGFLHLDLARVLLNLPWLFFRFITEESVATLLPVASLRFYICFGGHVTDYLPQLDHNFSEVNAACLFSH